MSEIEYSGLYMSLTNSELYTITQTPNTSVTTNKWDGKGLGVDGPVLRNISSSALAEYVKGGAIGHPPESYYITNEISSGFEYSWFDITFNINNVYPIISGTIPFRVRANKDPVTSTSSIDTLSLWAKKSNNPALAGDVWMGNGPDINISFSEPGFQVYESEVVIEEANRASWQLGMPGLYISASGRYVYFSNASSGVEQLNGMEITISGTLDATVGTPYNSGVNLYTQGHSPSTSTLNLYTINFLPASSSLELSVLGGVQTSGSLDLFTMAGMSQSVFDLYEAGHITSSGRFDLYIAGHLPSNSGIDLFVKGHIPWTSGINLTLVGPTYGTAVSGTDMVMFAPSYYAYSGSIPMVLYQDTTRASSVDLFIQNAWTANSGTLRMYLAAPSGTYGAVPFSGSIPMFIARNSEAIDAGINMWISGPNETFSGVPMTISGTYMLASGINLSMSGGHSPTSTINLFAHGF